MSFVLFIKRPEKMNVSQVGLLKIVKKRFLSCDIILLDLLYFFQMSHAWVRTPKH